MNISTRVHPALGAALCIGVIFGLPVAKAKAQMQLEGSSQTQLSGNEAQVFVPSDASIERIYQGTTTAAVVYQYRIEFYEVTPGTVLRIPAYRAHNDGNSGPPLAFRGVAKASAADMKLVKTLTFKHHIAAQPWKGEPNPSASFWVCSTFNAYTAADSKERSIIGGAIDWTNNAGQKDDFCGVLSFDGRVTYQLPFTQHFPDRVIELEHVTRDVSRAFLKVGALGEEGSGDEGEGREFNISEILIWQSPSNLERIDATHKSPDEIRQLEEQYMH